MNKNELFVFMGRSGCGKGTQVALFIEQLKKEGRSDDQIYYLETGQQIRNLVEGDSYSSRIAKDIMERGERHPSFLASWTWTSLLMDGMREGTAIILDGSPRSQAEADTLDTVLGYYGIEKGNFVYMDVSREWAHDRLLGREREYDNEERINTRLDWFETDVGSVMDGYEKNEKFNFIKVNGEQSIEDVHKDIIKIYDSYKN